MDKIRLDLYQKETAVLFRKGDVVNKVTRPELYIWTSDHTHYFPEEFRNEFGLAKIECYYLFDNMTHTHLCSITPSVWLEYIDFGFDMVDGASEAARERAYDKLMDGYTSGEDSCYANAPRNVVGFKPVAISDKEYDELCEMVETDPEHGYNDWITKQAEYLRASGV